MTDSMFSALGMIMLSILAARLAVDWSTGGLFWRSLTVIVATVAVMEFAFMLVDLAKAGRAP